jgi:purine-binding chemotaxis protein CheW
MINLRGNIIPIISLRKRLGLPEAAPDINTCVAVMIFSGEMIGFIIDEISEVIHIKRSEIQPAAEIVGQPWIEGTIQIEEKLVVALNLEQLG